MWVCIQASVHLLTCCVVCQKEEILPNCKQWSWNLLSSCPAQKTTSWCLRSLLIVSRRWWLPHVAGSHPHVVCIPGKENWIWLPLLLSLNVTEGTRLALKKVFWMNSMHQIETWRWKKLFSLDAQCIFCKTTEWLPFPGIKLLISDSCRRLYWPLCSFVSRRLIAHALSSTYATWCLRDKRCWNGSRPAVLRRDACQGVRMHLPPAPCQWKKGRLPPMTAILTKLTLMRVGRNSQRKIEESSDVDCHYIHYQKMKLIFWRKTISSQV